MACSGPGHNQQAESAALRAGGRDPHAAPLQRLTGHRAAARQTNHRPPQRGAG